MSSSFKVCELHGIIVHDACRCICYTVQTYVHAIQMYIRTFVHDGHYCRMTLCTYILCLYIQLKLLVRT